MKNLFTILLASALSGSIYAQAPVIQWQKAFGGSLEDSGGSITKTSDGGYLLAGSSASNDGDVTGNQGGLDWWVVKVDNLGAIQWETTLGGSADEILYRAIQTSDGGYALAGWTESNDGDVTGYQGNKDCWVAKLNSSGVLQWQNTIGGTAEEEVLNVPTIPQANFDIEASPDAYTLSLPSKSIVACNVASAPGALGL